jgi:hypothetical protein
MHDDHGGRSPSLRVCLWGCEEGNVRMGGGGRAGVVVRVRDDGRASRQGVQRAAQEKVEVCLHLVPGGEDKGARVRPPPR